MLLIQPRLLGQQQQRTLFNLIALGVALLRIKPKKCGLIDEHRLGRKMPLSNGKSFIFVSVVKYGGLGIQIALYWI